MLPKLSDMRETKSFETKVESGIYTGERIIADVENDKITNISFTSKQDFRDVAKIINTLIADYNEADFMEAEELMNRLHNNQKISSLRDLINAVLQHTNQVRGQISPLQKTEDPMEPQEDEDEEVIHLTELTEEQDEQ